MIAIKEVLASEFMVVNADLVRQHWLEVGHTESHDIDVDRYKQLEDDGLLKTLGVYQDNEAIGYCSLVVTQHAHDKSATIGIVDSIYVTKKHRTIAGGKLIKSAEALAKEYGAQDLTWFCEIDSKLHLSLVKHGYKVGEVSLKKEV